VNLARVQGGRQIQTGGILLIFRGFEFVAQRRNRVRGADSGWALTCNHSGGPLMKNNEKRKHSRIDSMNLLNYVYHDENDEEVNQGMGRTLNVSESGILLETHNRIDPSNIISLTIGLKENVVDIEGRVIYAKENIRGMFESGIEFFEMDDSAREVLKSYIQAFNAQSAE
jgi:hypothetical protein